VKPVAEPWSLYKNCDVSEARTVLAKVSDKLRRIARYLTNFSGDFNNIDFVAVD